MSTYQEMIDNTRTDLTIDPNKTVWSDDQLGRYINQFIGIVYSWDNQDYEEVTGSFTLVAGQATYDLGAELTNYGKLQSLRLDDETVLLDKVTDLNAFQNGRDLTAQGEPRWYYEYGDNTIGLYPVPDGNITTMHSRYNRSNPTISGSEEPAFDSKWHFVCELYAKWKALRAVPGYEQQAREAQQDYFVERQAMKWDLYKRDVNGQSWTNTNPGVWPDSYYDKLKVN